MLEQLSTFRSAGVLGISQGLTHAEFGQRGQGFKAIPLIPGEALAGVAEGPDDAHVGQAVQGGPEGAQGPCALWPEVGAESADELSDPGDQDAQDQEDARPSGQDRQSLACQCVQITLGLGPAFLAGSLLAGQLPQHPLQVGVGGGGGRASVRWGETSSGTHPTPSR